MRRRAGLLLAVLLLAACGQQAPSRPVAAASRAPASSPSAVPNMAVSEPTLQPFDPSVGGPPGPPAPAQPHSAPPVRLRIPSIGVDTSVGRLDLNPDGTIQVPADFGQAGWYDRGPAPGEAGPAVVLGHLDSYTGPAVFARLGSLRAGAEVVVLREDGSELRFLVDSVASFSSDSFPTDQVYGATPGPALRLITCGGTFSVARGRYNQNVVAFATLAGGV